MPNAGASLVRVIGPLALLTVLAAPSGCGAAGNSDGAAGSKADAGAGLGNDSGGSIGSGGAASSLVRWCDAYQVITCACQQCHRDPPRNGAAMPLMTYEDTQRPFPSVDSAKKVWQQMEQSVMNGSMPFTADTSVVPPAQPLTPGQRATLLAWLAEGAHDEGGRACAAGCAWP